MSDNPYTTPENTSGPTIVANDSNLPKIAKLQRSLNFSILGYFAVIILAAASPKFNDLLMGLVGLSIIGVCIFAFIVVIRLAGAMGGTISAVLHAIGLFIPIIGLLVLLILNNRATRLLKKGGYKVGLLGAKQVPNR